MLRLACALLLMAAAGSASAESVERQVSAGGFPATLTMPGTMPGGVASRPMVLFIAGSGPTDRHGNSPAGVSAGYLGKLARALADQGIASLRYDKRSVAGSVAVADESAVTFRTFVEDAGKVLDWLWEEHGPRGLVLAGHSEGGLIALELAANRPEPGGVVLLATPGRPPAEVLREQLTANLAEPLLGRALGILSEIEAGRAVDDVPPQLMALFRPSVQPFLRSLMALEPAQRLRSLGKPALVVGGGRDLQVGRRDFDALAMGAPDVTPLWLSEMNHVLVDVGEDRQANIAAYADADAPLAAGLADAVAAFIGKLPANDAPAGR